MRTLRAYRGMAIWLAAWALLLGALAPSLSHALSASNGVPWAEVCSVQGARLVRLDDGGDRQAPPVAKHVLEHCPYCSIHVPTLGAPAKPWTAPLLLDLHHEFPLVFLAAPRTPHAWISAQPRAPPLHS